MEVGLSLMENVLRLLAKNVLLSLGVTAAVSETDATIRKNIYEFGMTTLLISNKEMDDLMKIVKSLEEACLLIEGVSETI